MLRIPTSTPYNTTLYCYRNNVVAEGGCLASSLDVEKFNTSSFKRPLKKGEGIPKQEFLVLRSTAISTKQLEKAEYTCRPKIQSSIHVPIRLPCPSFKQVWACLPWAPLLRVSSTKESSSYLHYIVSMDDLLFSYQRCWLGQTWPCPHAFVPVHTWECKIQL